MRVLILGVTPELYRLPWQEDSDVQAVDRSSAMIEMVWPGPRSAVRNEDWADMSLPDESRDVVLCDGGFHLLDHPAGQKALVRSLARIIVQGGCFIVRLFVPPATAETPGAVVEDVRRGQVGNVNELKLRLDMALQRNPESGVRLGDVWEVFHAAEPDPEGLADRVGWTAEEARSVQAYAGSESRYHFVTLAEVDDMFCRDPGGFERTSVFMPNYELGERCPTVTFTKTLRR